MKVTQRDRILRYIQDFGSITSWEAYKELGVTQVATRIYELKKRGYKFKKERIYTTNRYGETTHYDKYMLMEE